MKKSRFAESQIVDVLKENEAGVSVAEILRRHGISKQSYVRWKVTHGRARLNERTRQKELEHENAKLMRMFAELSPKIAAKPRRPLFVII